MSDSENPTPSGRFPTFQRFFRLVFNRRTLRRSTFVLACAVTGVALFYAEENWRGRHAWNRYRLGLEGAGAGLDYNAFIPPAVPADRNFAATPFIESWFEKRTNRQTFDDQWWRKDAYSSAAFLVKEPEGRAQRQFVDLAAWAAAFEEARAGRAQAAATIATGRLDRDSRARAAPAVLEALKDDEACFSELRAAARRPQARYPIHYDMENPWGILVPHLANLRYVCLRLQLRACAELAAGHSDAALEDVDLMLRVADSVKDEPLLISYLIRLARLQDAVQPVWEGLAEHRWSDAQLQELQARLLAYDFLKDMRLPLEGERAAGILTADLIYRGKYHVGDLFGPPEDNPSDLAEVVRRLAPRGWYYLEQVNYCRLYENQMNGAMDVVQRRVFPAKIAAHAHELEREIAGGRLGKTLNCLFHHQLLAAMLLPALGNVPLKAAVAQTAADQAALGCALERFRLAHGHYPESLDTLVPSLVPRLPRDIVSGEPLKYRRNVDGQFLLYSVGWNETDDGGAAIASRDKSGSPDFVRGDWVWRYPAE